MATGQQWLFAPAKPLVERLGKRFFRKIPARPGVYSMRDATGAVVYVGKAKNLRQRLRSYRVANLAPTAKKRFIYEYDFGDSWEHEVVVEKVLPPDAAFKHPVCLDGANAAPPEDCGGSPGYADFVDAMADPKHEQHAEMKEWVGGAWDATRFSLEAANAGLKRLKA